MTATTATLAEWGLYDLKRSTDQNALSSHYMALIILVLEALA